MKYTYFHIVVCLSLFLNSFASDGKVIFDETENSIVNFELVKGLLLLPVQVDGDELVFILDSGSPGLILNEKIAHSEVLFTSVDKDLPAVSYMLKEVVIGPLKKNGVHSWKMDLAYVEKKIGRKIGGIIGNDFFSSHDIILDFKNLEISFLSSDSASEYVPDFPFYVTSLSIISFVNTLPIVEANIEGTQYQMIFDTGAAISVLHSDKATELTDKIALKLENLTVKDILCNNTDLSELPGFVENKIDGILSATSLNADRIIISMKRSEIYLFHDMTKASQNEGTD